MNLLQRARRARTAQRFSPYPDAWAAGDLPPAYFYNPGRTINGEFETSNANLDLIAERIYKQSGPVASLIMLRMALFSEARFQWQRIRNGRPGDLFGNAALDLLEHPDGPTSTTGDLLARAEQDVSLLGNAFLTNMTKDPETGLTVPANRLKRLRPDWVTMVYGSHYEPELAGDALDGELLGYIYSPRMEGALGDAGGTVLLPNEVAHYAPYPDPQFYKRGMSWLTPVIREVLGDDAALDHKNAFFRNSASPRLAVKLDPSIDKENFERFTAMVEANHAGPWNAYKTLYLAGGADPVPITMSMKDLDYKAVTGAGETRLAAAAGIHPVVIGFSEGLSGSSLNAGNYGQAKRRVADGTLRPLWRNFAGSMEALFPPPDDGTRLWYDDRDIAFLRDDATDQATITQKRASTALTLINAGYEPDTVTAAVQSGDLSGLKHTGLYSVQLQPPGNGEMDANGKTEPDPAAEPQPEPAVTPEDGPTS